MSKSHGKRLRTSNRPLGWTGQYCVINLNLKATMIIIAFGKKSDPWRKSDNGLVVYDKLKVSSRVQTRAYFCTYVISKNHVHTSTYV